MERVYYVYIVASNSRVLYTGVTNSLTRRSWEHKTRRIEGFAKRYHCYRLVYAEAYPTIREAIQREKQLKSWRREKKLRLINQSNPHWRDLVDD